jgi:GTPase involved in cell partitioning and DNA repair
MDTVIEIIAQLALPALKVDADAQRTQQVTMEFSTDGGRTFRTGFVQEYTFSPRGSTYQREDLSLNLPQVSHMRLIIVPNKGGSGMASLTSVRLFS